MFALPSEGSIIHLSGKFLKILKKLFSKSFLSGCRAEPCISLRPGKKKRKIGNEVTNFGLVFSAKKLTVCYDNLF